MSTLGFIRSHIRGFASGVLLKMDDMKMVLKSRKLKRLLGLESTLCMIFSS
jgi:hypothetical protein